MSAGNNEIYPNSNTYTGESMLEAAFDDLLKYGINTDVNLNGFKIINLAPGTNSTDAVNVSQLTAGTSNNLNTISTLYPNTGNVDMNNFQIVNMNDPTLAQDAATKNYVDSDVKTKIQSTDMLSQVDCQNTGPILITSNQKIDLGNNIITNSALPLVNSDLANKLYVDTVNAGDLPITATLHDISILNPNNGDVLIGDFDLTQVKDLVGSNNCVIGFQNANEIDVTVNSQLIDNIQNQPGDQDIQHTSSGFQFQMQQVSGSLSNPSSSFNIYGQKPDSGSLNELNLNLIQNYYGTNGDICAINMGLSGNNNGGNILFGAGQILSNPVGEQNFSFIQSNSSAQDILAFSSGIVLNDNTQVLFADKNVGTNPIQTQFTRKTGYQPTAAITITENDQFPTKFYVDSQIIGSQQSLADISVQTPNLSSVDMNNQKIINMSDPTLAQDAVTKNYVDLNTLISTSTLNSIATTNLTSGSVDMNNNLMINLLDPVSNQDAASKNYVDTTTLPSTTTLNDISSANPTSNDVNINNHFITNVLDPTSPQEAATKNYVDNIVGSLQDIYDNNPSDLDIGTNVFTSSAAASGNQIPNNTQVLSEINSAIQAILPITFIENTGVSETAGIYCGPQSNPSVGAAGILMVTSSLGPGKFGLLFQDANNPPVISGVQITAINSGHIQLICNDLSMGSSNIIDVKSAINSGDAINQFDISIPTASQVRSVCDSLTANSYLSVLTSSMLLKILGSGITNIQPNANSQQQFINNTNGLQFASFVTTVSGGSLTLPINSDISLVSYDSNINLNSNLSGKAIQIQNVGTTIASFKSSNISQTASQFNFILPNGSPLNLQNVLTTYAYLTCVSGFAIGSTVQNCNFSPNGTDLSFNSTQDNITFNIITVPSLKFHKFQFSNVDSFTIGQSIVNCFLPLNMASQKITSLANGTNPNDAVNFSQISGLSGQTLNAISVAYPTSASVDMNSFKLINVLNPTSAQDASTKNYVDTTTLISTSTLNSIATANLASASVNLNSQKIINLATPTLSTDATNKSYVDAFVSTTIRDVTSPTSSVVCSTNLVTNRSFSATNGLIDFTIGSTVYMEISSTSLGTYGINVFEPLTMSGQPIFNCLQPNSMNTSLTTNNQYAITKQYLVNNVHQQLSSDYTLVNSTPLASQSNVYCNAGTIQHNIGASVSGVVTIAMSAAGTTGNIGVINYTNASNNLTTARVSLNGTIFMTNTSTTTTFQNQCIFQSAANNTTTSGAIIFASSAQPPTLLSSWSFQGSNNSSNTSILAMNAITTNTFFISASSRELKKEWFNEDECLQRSLDNIHRLKFHGYKWKDEQTYGSNCYTGLFAEELIENQSFPEYYHENSLGIPSIRKDGLVEPCLLLVKYLIKENCDLKTRLELIEKKLGLY